MTTILAGQSAEARAKGEALIRQADKLLCRSWNERMWADGGSIDPSPTVDQAINGGYAWLEIECPRCKSRRERRSGGTAPSAHHAASTTSPAVSAAANVLRPADGPPPRFCN